MSQKIGDSFESRFHEVLTTELRRQGLRNADDLCKSIVGSMRLVGITTLAINASDLNLNDRACVAFIESLLKMMHHIASPAEWTVNLSKNTFSDRVVGHIVLLVERCTRLSALDISHVEGITSNGITRIEEVIAKAKLSRGRLELFTSSPASQPVHRVDSKHQGRVVSEVESATPVSSVTHPSREPSNGIDIAALKRRREALLREEAAAPTETVKPQVISSQRVQASAASTPRGVNRQPSRSRTRSPQTPKPRMVKQEPKHVAPPATSQRATSIGRTPSSAPVVAAKRTIATKPAPLTKQLLVAASQPTAPPTVREQLVLPSRVRSGSVSSDRTTATEVPDQQDYLDITANINPMIDHVVSLEHQGVPSDVLIRRLKDALRPGMAQPFTSITVLNISSNHLHALDGSILPPSLLRIDLSDNQLTIAPSFAECPMLTVVNLRRNHIKRIGDALERNLNIGHLFLGRNELTFIDGIGHLWVLETLDLSYNAIESVVHLRPLSLNSALRHLVLTGNPVETKSKNYRPTLRNLVPSLIAIDNHRLPFSKSAEQRLQADLKIGHDAATVAKPGSGPASSTGYAVRNMLCKGITGLGSVYSDKAVIHSSRKRIVLNEQRKNAVSKAATTKPLSRKEVVERLCDQSKKFLEQTIVDRLTAAERRRQLEGASHKSSTPASRSPSRGVEQELPLFPHTAVDHDEMADAMSDFEETSDNEGLVTVVPLLRPSVQRTEPLRPRGASSSPSPAPDRPASHDAQKALDALLSRPSKGRSEPSASRPPIQPLAHEDPVAALATRPTASSLNRVRSRSASNASSRSPSPIITEGTKALAVHQNEPLSAALKLANTPRSLKATLRPSKEPAQYTTPSRPLYQQQANPYAATPMHPMSPPSDEIVLSPEGVSALSPLKYREHVKDVSPIRNALEMTDLSADDTNFAQALVTRMDPGPAASPLPRPQRGPVQSTPLSRKQAPPRAPIVSPSDDRRPRSVSKEPSAARRLESESQVSTKPSPNVQAWVQQFHRDAGAVQMSLRTVVDLVWSSLHAEDPETAARLAEERSRCLEIVNKSRMLEDTDIPISVVRYYGFRPDELNDPNVARAAVAAQGETERGELLEGIHEMGSSKTCLRYLVALVQHGRDDLLRRYVENIKADLFSS